MSYILDALRKSDQQRQRGATPTLLTPQAASVVTGRRLSMPHVLLAVLLMGVGIVVGALRPWQSEPPAATQAPLTVQAARPPVATTQPKSTLRPSPAPVQVPMPIPSEPQLPVQITAPAMPPPASVAPPVPVAVPALPPATEKPDAAVAQEQKVMTMAELPLSIQQEIPNMSISVHAYSRSAQERLLGINDRMLREGDFLIPGLQLEQITPDGMIMRYKGYRFWHAAR
ncbi:MAG: general secretion pathway protein GspB [Georgfuchsia sp.]